MGGKEGMEQYLKEHEEGHHLISSGNVPSFHMHCQPPYLQNWPVGFSDHSFIEWNLDYRTIGTGLMLWNRNTISETGAKRVRAWVSLFFLPGLHSLLPYSIPGSAWWRTPLWVCEWETLGVSLLLLIRTGQRFRSPVSPFIIISSHSFAKVNPIPSSALQRPPTTRQSSERKSKNIRIHFKASESY